MSGMDDRQAVAAQIGRPLRSGVDVVARCHLEMPVVSRVPPILDDGTPFPTRYWLSCPLASRRISRIESAGGVQAIDRKVAKDADFAAAVDEAHERYRAERDAAVPEDADPRPSGGVAGAVVGVKCLHAHYADMAAGNENPIGTLVSPWVDPLDCEMPCVVDDGDDVILNPGWREPA